MTRDEMHVTFRVLGQQMGMQMVRGILPESIDTFLNVAQIEKIQQVIQTHTRTEYKDKVSNQDNDYSLTNTLGDVYVSKYFIFDDTKQNGRHKQVSVNLDINSIGILAVDISYDELPKIENKVDDTSKDIFENFIPNTVYGSRIIERDRVQQTLNDYCNDADDYYPIVVSYGNKLVAYSKIKNATCCCVHYVKYPATISSNTNCELPEATHYDIVQLAVNKFFQSVLNTGDGRNQ